MQHLEVSGAVRPICVVRRQTVNISGYTDALRSFINPAELLPFKNIATRGHFVCNLPWRLNFHTKEKHA